MARASLNFSVRVAKSSSCYCELYSYGLPAFTLIIFSFRDDKVNDFIEMASIFFQKKR